MSLLLLLAGSDGGIVVAIIGDIGNTAFVKRDEIAAYVTSDEPTAAFVSYDTIAAYVTEDSR